MNNPKKLIKRVVIENRKAKFLYTIESTFEAGIVLEGFEVKSLRLNRCSLQESYAYFKKNELFLFQWNLAPCGVMAQVAAVKIHDATRPKKLLLKRKELNKIRSQLQIQGCTVVPLRLYENEKGYMKIVLGIGKGKNLVDRRASIKEREWKREQSRLPKQGPMK
jgi:SsrA-binding protein